MEYSRYEDFKRALRDLDDSKFRSHEVYTYLVVPCAESWLFSYREKQPTYV